MTARRAVLSLQALPSEGVVAMVESLDGGEVSFVQVSGRHGVQNVAQCVACAALTLVVWQ